jgi:hypothetical protein
MKTRPETALPILIAFTVLLAIACSSTTLFPRPTSSARLTATRVSRLLHFEDDRLVFDYPAGMKVFKAGDAAFHVYPDIQLGGELLAGLGDPKFSGYGRYYRSISLYRRQLPPGSDLDALMLETYRLAAEHYPPNNGLLNFSGPLTVTGLPAVQKAYRVYSGEPAYELRDIWIQREDELFILAIWTEYTNPEDFAAFQAGAESLLASLVIK